MFASRLLLLGFVVLVAQLAAGADNPAGALPTGTTPAATNPPVPTTVILAAKPSSPSATTATSNSNTANPAATAASSAPSSASPTPSAAPSAPAAPAPAAKAAGPAAARASKSLKRRFPIPAKIYRYAERLVARYDTNNDGVLQPDEWAKLQGEPKQIDIDRDGNISADEIAMYAARYALQHRIHVAPPPGPGVRDLTAAGEKSKGAGAIRVEGYSNGYGYGDEEEFEEEEIEEPQVVPGSVTETLGRRVPRYLQRFQTPVSQLQGLPEWFLSRDADGDGQLTVQEFSPKSVASEILEFSRYDTDHDGVITPKEILRPTRPPPGRLQSTKKGGR